MTDSQANTDETLLVHASKTLAYALPDLLSNETKDLMELIGKVND